MESTTYVQEVSNLWIQPSITEVTPSAATAGVPANFTVTGQNLPLTAVMSIADGSCQTPTSRTSSGFTVVCTPGSGVGNKVVTIKTDLQANGGTEIYPSKLVEVAAQPVARVASVGTVTPTTATVNVPTTFTVTGNYLPLTAVMSIADGTCQTPTNRTSTGFTVVCTPGGAAGSKVVTIKTDTLAHGGTVIDANKVVNVVQTTSLSFFDSFVGAALDSAKWTVEALNGNLATYTQSNGFLNIMVPGGSCGFCGVSDGARFRPQVAPIVGDFELVLSAEEINRTSRDSTNALSTLQLLMTGSSAELGIYLVGDVTNNQGVLGHQIITFYRSGSSVVYPMTRSLTVGQYYAFQFRIRRSGGLSYIAYRLSQDATWTETAVPSSFLANAVSAPSIVIASGDGGGTQINSSFQARFDSVTIGQSAGLIPDTGITANQCYQAGSNAFVSCTSAGAIALNEKQDGMIGRDLSTPDNSDGKLGFSYSTVGSYLKTECVRDNITGLTWEGKPTSGLRVHTAAYTNYGDSRSGDASAYVTAVNTAALCGFTDWRLPTRWELQSLVDYSVAFPGPTIDSTWFPNTQSLGYWSSNGYAGNANVAWCVDFDNGDISGCNRSGAGRARLVR